MPTSSDKQPGPLAGFRVVELADEKGMWCGKLLADLGAEVIKVEKPGGDATRRIPPFKGGVPHREGSLSFLNGNSNKSSISLDLETPADRETFLRLIGTADVLVETLPPECLERLGLGYSALRRVNPGLVLTSVTGFGQWGPYRDYKADDLVLQAMGGLMFTAGEPGHAPWAAPEEQAYQLGSIHAAYGALLALHHRLRTGWGQHVEVSLQEVVAHTMMTVVSYGATQEVVQRSGSLRPTCPNGLYPCQDGFVLLIAAMPQHWKNLAPWMGIPEFLDPRWEDLYYRSRHRDYLNQAVSRFTSQFHKEDLAKQAQARRIPVAPMNTLEDFVHSPHLRERNWLVQAHHPHIGPHWYPGPPYRLSLTPWRLERSAPLVGEHTEQLRSELRRRPFSPGLSAEQTEPMGGPLEGVRVLDLGRAWAGGYLGRYLADFGAQVIKVEARERPDGSFRIPQAKVAPKEMRLARAHFAEMHRNKLGITLDLDSAEGREQLKRLVAISDVLLENHAPRVMPSLGLDYTQLRQTRPDLIMVSLPGFGNSGPTTDYISFGNVILAYSGMSHLWGRPHPSGTFHATIPYPDLVAAAYGAVAVMAALIFRLRTGEGQYIEVPQVEATASLLGTSVLDRLVNQRNSQPCANQSQRAAPFGCFRCRGEDRWCVIAVYTDAEWRSLCRAMGEPPWTQDPRFATLPQRLQHSEELNQRVEAWSLQHTPQQVMEALQAAGVPSGVVQSGEDLYQDPHLRARDFLATVQDPLEGPLTVTGPTVRLSRAPGAVRRPPPELGQHNAFVHEELLGTGAGHRPAL